jgi:hypothetical protein
VTPDEILKRDERIAQLTQKYGSAGQELEFGLRIVDRYQPTVARQHSLMMEQWRSKDHNRALAELHFMLIAMDAVWRGLRLLAKHTGGNLDARLKSIDWSGYNDAPNHFELLDDRLYGNKKNAPKPVTESTRTIEFGLKGGPPQRFEFGDRSIDVSADFLAKQQKFVDNVIGAL